MNDYAYLNALESDYQQAETAETNGRLPNGRYTAILNEARIYPPDEKKSYPRFSTSWVVTEGPYKGRFLYLSFNFTPQGFPYYKAFAKGVGVDVPHLAMLPDHLADYSGKIGLLTLADDRQNPQYQRVYFDRLVGTGQVSDYLKPKAPPADPDFEPLPDEDDVPF